MNDAEFREGSSSNDQNRKQVPREIITKNVNINENLDSWKLHVLSYIKSIEELPGDSPLKSMENSFNSIINQYERDMAVDVERFDEIIGRLHGSLRKEDVAMGRNMRRHKTGRIRAGPKRFLYGRCQKIFKKNPKKIAEMVSVGLVRVSWCFIYYILHIYAIFTHTKYRCLPSHFLNDIFILP